MMKLDFQAAEEKIRESLGPDERIAGPDEGETIAQAIILIWSRMAPAKGEIWNALRVAEIGWHSKIKSMVAMLGDRRSISEIRACGCAWVIIVRALVEIGWRDFYPGRIIKACCQANACPDEEIITGLGHHFSGPDFHRVFKEGMAAGWSKERIFSAMINGYQKVDQVVSEDELEKEWRANHDRLMQEIQHANKVPLDASQIGRTMYRVVSDMIDAAEE